MQSCASPAEPALFELLPPGRTGVTFANSLPEDTAFNILNYLYYYNGAGVAVGDVDNDGLPDLYFSSNLGRNALYLNKGNYRFEDVTQRAGVAGPEGWKTGVTMADINGDGRVDIYVSAVTYLGMHGHNVLYVNNGDGTFTDRTVEYGLDFAGYSTQAAFFDYDGDGDLDMYLLNHSTHTERSVRESPRRDVRHPRAGDRLYRNDGKRFTDVSAEAGIYGGVEGYGLGVVASDVNLDGCPDIYVANDFQENDFLYINNCDGTFTESIGVATGHTSRFSMGVDAADFNNDGRPDLVVADMLPEREEIFKTTSSTESFGLYDLRLRAGYHPQFARNTLQLNRGRGLFSDIGFLAGVAATDWSWAPLFADLDNDGWKDLFITNGIFHRPNDLDYIDYVSNEAVQASLANGVTKADLQLLERMPSVPLSNYAFRNGANLHFTNVATRWGLAQPGFSNGAVYADLNNSGALDLVVSNVNAPASIYRNRARELTGAHYLMVTLRGEGANTGGIGARVTIVHGANRQMLEQMPTRGFQSSVDPRLHFGLGATARIDSLIVTWPDRRVQVLTDVPVDQRPTLSQRDAQRVATQTTKGSPTLFEDVTTSVDAAVPHVENTVLDYNREPLIPHVLSTEGPALATGDANGDGLEDIYVGGGKWQSGQLLLQRPNGTFAPSAQPAFVADTLPEDVDAAFFDADGDGDLDLYVVSGGNEFTGADAALQDRLYLNESGHFRRDFNALPRLSESGSCVVPGDFDGDGDVDLFVGRRVVTGRYGLSPKSYLLLNDGRGHFTDVTSERAPALAEAGMVTAAAWLDANGDGALDLVVVGEWMPVRVFRQENGRFVDRTAESGLGGTEGWWNSISLVDVNADGRPDLVLGNLGLNSYMQASATEPARMYVGDFFHTGTLEQIITFYKNGISYPLPGRDDLTRVMPSLRSRYPTYASFGASRIEDILPRDELRRAKVLEARVFASSIALSNTDGTFRLLELPVEAQFAPVYGAASGDFDGDGHVDLVLAGNLYGVQPALGRYDASYGVLLRGTGDGYFVAVDLERSNFVVRGQARHVRTLRDGKGRALVVVARNGATLQVLRSVAAASREHAGSHDQKLPHRPSPIHR